MDWGYIFDTLIWFLTPDYADYNANPILFWIQVCIAGSLYGFVFIGIVGVYTIYTDGEA
mgnify:CR=1 FL=1|tara:strand:+ start:858 stop:1034 length:177 start_codon:yes stop_codon:yes gene_type:complete